LNDCTCSINEHHTGELFRLARGWGLLQYDYPAPELDIQCRVSLEANVTSGDSAVVSGLTYQSHLPLSCGVVGDDTLPQLVWSSFCCATQPDLAVLTSWNLDFSDAVS